MAHLKCLVCTTLWQATVFIQIKHHWLNGFLQKVLSELSKCLVAHTHSLPLLTHSLHKLSYTCMHTTHSLCHWAINRVCLTAFDCFKWLKQHCHIMVPFQHDTAWYIQTALLLGLQVKAHFLKVISPKFDCLLVCNSSYTYKCLDCALFVKQPQCWLQLCWCLRLWDQDKRKKKPDLLSIMSI